MKVLARILWLLGAYAASCFAAAVSIAELMKLMLPPDRLNEDADLLEPTFVAAALAITMAFPVFTTIVPAEVYGIRYLTYYLTAGLLWAGFLFLMFIGRLNEGMIIFPLSGAVGGLAFWLVAGRKAGTWR